MPLPIVFDRRRAQKILDAMSTGKPIPPGPQGWSVNDCLITAGVCSFLVWNYGPATKDGKELNHVGMTDERRAHVARTFRHEINAAIEFYGHLFQMVWDGEYAQHYEDKMQCALSVNDIPAEPDRVKIHPISGFKKL